MFANIYRISFYLMLCLATLVVSIDATDSNPIAMLYPVAVAFAGVLAFFTVDRNPKLGLDRGTADILAIATISLSYIEYRYDENLLLLALAHWLVYLAIVKMFLPKQIRDDWTLFLVNLVLVLIGGVMSQSDTVGAVLFAWAITSLWVLWLFSLHREALRAEVADGTARFPSIDPKEPYPNLVDLPFIFAALRVAATTLALGGVIFLVMPRRPSMGQTITGDLSGKHLTGFDDDVRLGQLGEILENDSVVFTAVLLDKETRKRYNPGAEPLWRGVSLARYSRGRWRKHGSKVSPFPADRSDRFQPPPRTVIQEVKLEATDSQVLFGLQPILKVKAGPGIRPGYARIQYDDYDGSIERVSPSNTSYDYTVESDERLGEPQPFLSFPDWALIGDLNKIERPEINDRLREVVEPLIRDIPRTETVRIARRLESYLRDSGLFHYTLAMDIIDPKLDPVVDFVVNRKEGHCEYFASALALMLRSQRIPCRLVNGFKGGDYNDLTGAWVVRQKHAHSWVEVLVNRSTENAPAYAVWETFDPTPGTERDASVARVSGFAGNFRQFSDFIRFGWTFYVVGFNAERQQRLLYGPIRELFLQAKYGYQILWEAFKKAIAWVFDFPSLAAFISVRGFIVSFVSLTLLAGLVRLGIWIFQKILRRIRGAGEDASMLAAGTLFYRRLVELLNKLGQSRTPAETPREFARRTALFLSSMGTGFETVADVPPQIVEAFYKIRFGRHDLTPDELSHLESRLDALEARIHPASS